MEPHKEYTQNLRAWYKKNARDLPWRRTKDPYKIWISEIMLQQTTVNAVIPFYNRWIKTYPTIEKVAKTPISRILKSWQGLGYYSRAKNIHKSAKIIVRDYAGKIPNTADELKKLPGFGPYTVGAVLSIAFDIRHPIIDANVRRIAMRRLGIEGFADTTQDKEILKFLDKILPKRCIGDFNQALMELGATICRNKEPVCLLCPVRAQCLAYKKGIQEIIPTPKKKIIKNLDVVIGVLNQRNNYFIQQRPKTGLLADLWEFPGGKIEQGEKPQDALRRELKEEIDVDVIGQKHLMNAQHFYTQFRVNLHVFECRVKTPPKVDKTHKWVNLRQLDTYPMPSGSTKIVEKLLSSQKLKT